MATDQGLEDIGSEVTGELIELMASKPLFTGLSARQLRKIAEIFKIVRFEPGEVVIKEKDYGDAIYVVAEGSVEVSVVLRDEMGDTHERKVTQIRACRPGELCVLGDFFGEMCLLDLEPRSATVTTMEATVLWEINRDDLYWVFGDDKGLQLRILMTTARILGRRLGAMDSPVSGGGDEES